MAKMTDRDPYCMLTDWIAANELDVGKLFAAIDEQHTREYETMTGGQMLGKYWMTRKG